MLLVSCGINVYASKCLGVYLKRRHTSSTHPLCTYLVSLMIAIVTSVTGNRDIHLAHIRSALIPRTCRVVCVCACVDGCVGARKDSCLGTVSVCLHRLKHLDKRDTCRYVAECMHKICRGVHRCKPARKRGSRGPSHHPPPTPFRKQAQRRSSDNLNPKP